MFKHNLLLTYRNFKRYKSTFFINLIGLSTGLAGVLLIYLWVNDELSFDKYHEKESRLYQVMYNTKSEKGIETRHDTPHHLSETLVASMPEVEYAATVTPNLFFPAFTLSGNNKQVKGVGKFSGKDFFKIFSYNLFQGNESEVLSNNNAIVLSESQAKNLFGSTTNIIGKTIRYDIPGMKNECIITGIFKDVPANSSEQFDFILPFDAFKGIMGMKPGWGAEPFNTYLVLKDGTRVINFNRKLTAFIKSKSKTSDLNFFLKPFSDNYLYSKYENGKEAGGRIEYVTLFSVIALAILIISCINFINLSTAKAARKVKEVGIKKAIGVGRKALIIHYMSESLLMSVLSSILAVGIVLLLLPHFNEITQKTLALRFNTEVCLTVLAITLATALLAGFYPAIYLTGFKPANVLRGRFHSSTGELWARKGLVVFQFCLSLVFIVSVLAIYKQIDYVQHKNLGFHKDNVIYFESEGKVSENPEAFLHKIQQIPGIEMASSMIGNLIGNEFGARGSIVVGDKSIPAHSFGVNYGMIETLGITVKEGRSFSKNFGATNSQLIVNEAAVEALGLKNPVGTVIKGENNIAEIVGVVKNFHFQSLHEKIMPMQFHLDNYTASTIVARIKSGKEKETISKLENFYRAFNPGFTFNYKFLDQDYQALYASEKQVSSLSGYFAFLAIFISCLGLFGLAAFTAERRIKEIGIRKVLGSSTFGIVRLLSIDFTKIVFVAICIALPLSYFITRNWLNNFAYKIDLEWWYFIGAGMITIVIALLTVSFQAVKAAVANPVKSLRTE